MEGNALATALRTQHRLNAQGHLAHALRTETPPPAPLSFRAGRRGLAPHKISIQQPIKAPKTAYIQIQTNPVFWPAHILSKRAPNDPGAEILEFPK